MKILLLVPLLSLFLPAGFVFAESHDAVHSITLPVVKTELKAGDGREKTEAFCAVCHSLDYITMQPTLTRAQWATTVNKMIKLGAPINKNDAQKIISYLTMQYGSRK